MSLLFISNHYKRDLKAVVKIYSFTMFFFIAIATPAFSQKPIPKPTNLYVNDYANLLTTQDQQEIKNQFSSLKQKQGIEATIVTINTIYDYVPSQTSFETFATQWFNTWGIGDAQTNKGILLLVAVNDRKVRLELGKGFAPSYNAVASQIIQSEIIPNFKQKNYRQGITQGAIAIARDFGQSQKETTKTHSQPAIETPSNVAMDDPETNSIWGWFLSIFGIGGGGIGIATYLRFRQRRCPKCQTLMERLDEIKDNFYLDQGQNLEEKIHSVDYDVWNCPSCGNHQIYHYKNWFSNYRHCPQCKYRTLQFSQKVITAATYESSGTALKTEHCSHCSYHSETTISLPQLVHSTSSSSSSDSGGGSDFGGGSSDGGGSSGDW